ncbi:two component regulator [Nitzschia inconspicua]|uniref:Two component regulator n=1 Tax=Nitzschia inconspicua TaxID=303405 RepID=A0A9K3LWY5_9STRA|nr:two component regulator [Nitzschia inconspicua]
MSSNNHSDASTVFETVDMMDTKPSAKRSPPTIPTSTSNDGISLTMIDPEISETVPEDEMVSISLPFEESLKAVAPEEAPSNPIDIDKTTVMAGGEEDDVETASSKDGLVKPSTTKNGTKKKPEMNPRYKDVQETGQWGDLSSREFYVAIAAFCLVIIAVILVVVFLVILPDNDNGSADLVVPSPAPTIPPTEILPTEELALVLAALQASPFTAPLLEGPQLPANPIFYQGFIDDNAGTPQQKALDWLLFQDKLKDPEQSVMRFALASFYFQMDGPNWASSEGWLTSAPLCQWEHISCDSRSVLQEMDFEEKNLSGTIPLEVVLLAGTGIQSFILSNNNVSGTIPGGIFASLPRLGILYLDDNALTGTVPAELVMDGRIHTLYVQGNQLAGDWPVEFCTDGTKLMKFGLDCDKLVCDPECCTPFECYYSS